jgi:hypothetical protein
VCHQQYLLCGPDVAGFAAGSPTVPVARKIGGRRKGGKAPEVGLGLPFGKAHGGCECETVS